MSKDEAMKMALEALEYIEHNYMSLPASAEKAIIALKQALEQPEPEPDRKAFERYWKKTRGEKKSDRELKRHPLQPQVYIQDSANRHWVTWQAATKKASTPKREWQGLTDEEIWNTYKNLWMFHPAEEPRLAGDVLKFARAIEAALGIKE